MLPVGDDYVNDVDHLKRCCSVNCYFRLNLCSAYFGCWHSDANPMVWDVEHVYDHNDYVHCLTAMLRSMVYCD